MLLSEYVGDTVLIKEERTIKSRKESLWKLANDLENAFNLPNPTTYELFKDAKEMNSEGFQDLFSYYEKGINRLNSILRQDVYKIELRIVKGCRARNIISYKSQNLKLIGKIVDNDDNNDDNDNDNNSDDNNNNGSNNNDNNRPVKRIYRRTTEDEKKLLEPILLFEEFPGNNEDIINDIS
ncbi:hypothetical protein C1646_764735 [Rhizophagus diaphanus]|nr:hypothetical protein C1646_764735 [Rhizophagus diaphanus] [Rhizophagus sp. MUCL 43196]